MYSIRRSMIICFLLLSGLSLAVVAGWMYQITQQTLQAKQEARSKVTDREYDEARNRERWRRKLGLLSQARTLAGMTQSQIQWTKFPQVATFSLGILPSTLTPFGHLQFPVWLGHAYHTPLRNRLVRIVVADIQLDEATLQQYLKHRQVDPDDPSPLVKAPREYFQIATSWGNTWRSSSLDGTSMPLRLDKLNSNENWANEQVAWNWETMTLADQTRVYGVIFKVPLTQYRFPSRWDRSWRGLRRSRGDRRGHYDKHKGPGREEHTTDAGHEKTGPPWPKLTRRDDRREGPVFGWLPAIVRPGNPRDGTDDTTRSEERYYDLPTVYVQCAWEDAPFKQRLDALEAERDAALAGLAEETRHTLAMIRFRLILIGGLTFAGVLIGGSLIIWRGLRPLGQVSEAVSRVSEKDFRLSIDRDRLPRELVPIVDRLTQTLTLLRRAFDREKQATADISHELRTPLAALLTTLEVTLRKPRESDQYRETLQECRSIGRQLSQLVERILQLARLDAGSDHLHLTRVNVAVLLEDCATVARPLAEVRGLDFSLSYPAGLSLYTDPDKLREVLLNLLHNAIEYNRPAGSVKLQATQQHHQFYFEVTDTGIGIAADAQERIFERFYRSDPARQETGIHAGLGLAIVKGYVERLGGQIEVKSVLHQGSTFRICLPVTEPTRLPALMIEEGTTEVAV